MGEQNVFLPTNGESNTQKLLIYNENVIENNLIIEIEKAGFLYVKTWLANQQTGRAFWLFTLQFSLGKQLKFCFQDIYDNILYEIHFEKVCCYLNR